LLKKVQPRFECIENLDGTWKVWDNLCNWPASLGSQFLINRPKSRAETACDILNRIYTRDMQYEPGRSGE